MAGVLTIVVAHCFSALSRIAPALSCIMENTHSQQVIWRTDALPQATLRALNFLSGQQWLKRSRWYLAGGTALALYAGHRQSQDLDFFLPQKNFRIEGLLGHLDTKQWTTDVAEPGTIYGVLCGARVSFIAYPFFVSREKPDLYGAVRVLHPRDIAVMKIIAVSQRGTKRDFVDLYWYAHHGEPLEDVLRRLPHQYPTVAHDYNHILKSLVYFDDAEEDPMPRLFFKADWPTIKRYFRREVPTIARRLLRLA